LGLSGHDENPPNGVSDLEDGGLTIVNKITAYGVPHCPHAQLLQRACLHGLCLLFS
jgi:hypothetical protein